MLEQFGFIVNVIHIFEDNTSTIWMTANQGNFARTKHLLVRRNFIKEQIDASNILVRYQSTDDMTADLGTKPLAAPHMAKHMKDLELVIKK